MKETKHFESGVALAWAVDIDRGYRQSAGLEWQFTKLDRSGSIADIIEEDLPSPEITISAVQGDKVKFTAGEGFIVLAYGAEEPIVSDTTVDVPYGSVLRIGPLLLAPLYSEQLESIHAGRMKLPVVPLIGAMDHMREDIDADLDVAAKMRKRVSRRWLTSWGLAILGAPLLSITLMFFICVAEEIYLRYLDLDIFIGITISQWLATFFIALPIQFSVMRWSRTPGASVDLSPESAGGGIATAWAIMSLAATLLLLPWLVGIATTTLLFLGCNPRGMFPIFSELVVISAVFSVVLSIALNIFAFMASNRLHRVVIRWLVPGARQEQEL